MVPTDGLPGAQGACRQRQQGTLARQRPDNETQESRFGHVGAGRCCHAGLGCGSRFGRRGDAGWRSRPDADRLHAVRGVRRRAGRPCARRHPGARPRLPQRQRGPRPRPRQGRAERPRIRCHDRVRDRHQPVAEHRRDLAVPARRVGRDPDGRRGRCRRQQCGRCPDHRRRHGWYRRFGRGDLGGPGRLHHQHQRRDQDPLLHAVLRRLQRRRVLHPDPGRHRQRRQQRQLLRPQGRRGGDGRPERGRRRPGLRRRVRRRGRSWPRWSASTAS